MPRSLSRNSTRQDLVDLGMRQAGHRLVGEQQLRLGRHGAGELELAHLDLGQVARQASGLVGEPDSCSSSRQRSSIAARRQMRAVRAH